MWNRSHSWFGISGRNSTNDTGKPLHFFLQWLPNTFPWKRPFQTMCEKMTAFRARGKAFIRVPGWPLNQCIFRKLIPWKTISPVPKRFPKTCYSNWNHEICPFLKTRTADPQQAGAFWSCSESRFGISRESAKSLIRAWAQTSKRWQSSSWGWTLKQKKFQKPPKSTFQDEW
jgi:hypothetical protein